jgi:hypothetical protein
MSARRGPLLSTSEPPNRASARAALDPTRPACSHVGHHHRGPPASDQPANTRWFRRRATVTAAAAHMTPRGTARSGARGWVQQRQQVPAWSPRRWQPSRARPATPALDTLARKAAVARSSSVGRAGSARPQPLSR